MIPNEEFFDDLQKEFLEFANNLFDPQLEDKSIQIVNEWLNLNATYVLVYPTESIERWLAIRNLPLITVQSNVLIPKKEYLLYLIENYEDPYPEWPEDMDMFSPQ